MPSPHVTDFMSRIPRFRGPHAGFSLIELLVGMAISLLVVVAAMGTLVYTRTASRMVGDSTRLQQEASTAFRMIGRIARQAGARRLDDTSDSGGQVIFNPQYTGYAVRPDNGRAVSVRGTDGLLNKPDTVEFSRDRGRWDSESVDCLGEETPQYPDEKASVDNSSKKELAVTNAFSVIATWLRCDGSGNTLNAQAVVSGVEDFQVWYGLREGRTFRYTTAAALNSISPSPWDQVESLRICLRLVGDISHTKGSTTTGCHGETIADDGRLRRAFFRVIQLRNLGQ